MSIFLLFALLGLFIFMAVVMMRPDGPRPADDGEYLDDPMPPPTTGPVTGGQFVAAVRAGLDRVAPDNPFARWVVSVLACSVPLALAIVGLSWNALLGLHSPQTPFLEAVGSRHLGGALFGLLFGFLLGYWLNSVFHREKEKPASYPEIVASAIMAIVLLIGLAGQDAITTMLARMTSVEIGGAKFGFTDGAANANSAPASLALSSGAGGLTATKQAPPGQSNGLDVLKSLPAFIERDIEIVRLLAEANKNPSGDDVVSGLQQAKSAVKEVLSPFVECLVSYVEATGDSGRVGRLLENIAVNLRQFDRSPAGNAARSNRWEGVIWERLQRLRDEADFEAPENHNSCKTVARATESDAGFENMIRSFRDNNWQKRPYLSITYGSMLAYDRQYVAAIDVLDKWLQRHKWPTDPFTSAVSVADDIDGLAVFRLRVLNTIAVYVTEWLDSTTGVQTPAVIKYQLDNLELYMRELVVNLAPVVRDPLRQTILEKSSMVDNNFARAPNDEGPCTAEFATGRQDFDTVVKPKLRLITAYLSARLNWIQAALDHPDYLERYARQAEAYAAELLYADGRCLQKLWPNDKSQVAIRRAEWLNSFARVTLANRTGSEALQRLLNASTTRQKLEEAHAAVMLAQQILARHDTPKNAANGFLQAIEATQFDETRNSLKRTERQLKSALANVH